MYFAETGHKVHKPTLYYFGTRGIAEPIRILLHEAKVDYEEVNLGTYNPEGQPKPFLDLIASGQLTFNQVPLWQEPDGLRLTQSSAIVRHLARKYNFYGSNEAEVARCDELAEGMLDFRTAVRGAAIGPDKAAGKKKVVEEIAPKYLGHFEKVLHANEGGKGFLVGKTPTYADFSLWYLLETFVDQGLGNLDHFPTLKAYRERIEAREAIAAFRVHPKRHPIQILFG